ncbi:oxidoreductase [Occultella glacieicola]|uniref:Oxidoreductase n=1 Tax=Occultella glacieicola TaxID=2518684 RepID=A0ABY2DWF6_9MICO|nr:aldo/keto reductase [Occultella glacieicola]TDE88134.1 oxidoreductase [Occultella glacieicola]
MTSPLRWAVLGPGRIARRFATQLSASAHGTLVAVASSDAGRARAFADEFAERHGSLRTGTYTQILADPEVDAVYIATVHTTHAQLAIAALTAGKHVLSEKPLAPNHAQAMAMVDAARTSGKVLLEAFMYRFHPQTLRLLELVADGAIGDLRHVDAAFAFATGATEGRLFDEDLAGGGILDVGAYPVSYARAIVGAATGAGFADPVEVRAAGTVENGVDTWAVADLGFANGTTASVRTGVRLADVSLTVYGSAGYIHLVNPWTIADDNVLTLAVVGQEPVTERFDGYSPYALEADALAEATGTGEVAGMSHADSLGNAVVLDAWRAQIGLAYPFERDEAQIPTVSGQPLTFAREQMRYGRIPGVDKDISRVVMGCDNQRTLPHAAAMFDHFAQAGGNAFDTAFGYGGGRMETLLGRWLATRGVREDVVVIAKGAHTPNCNPEALSSQLLTSLERLGIEGADVYMMHRDNPDIPVGEFVDVLDEHARAGRIGVFGGSNWTIERFEEANAYAAANGRQGFGVLSNHFGLAEAYDVPWVGCRHATDPESKEWLTRTGTPLLPWSSQARGFFARADPDDRSDTELVRCYYSDANFERLRRARELAQEFGVHPTAVALAFVLHQPFPTFPLIGPRTIAETRSSLESLAVELTPGQVDYLDLRADAP